MTLKNKKIVNTQFLNENIPFSQVLLVIDKEEKEIIDRQEALKRAKNFEPGPFLRGSRQKSSGL